MTTQKQIKDLRSAIKKDKLTKKNHEKHLKYLDTIQKYEREIEDEIKQLQGKLHCVQREIVDAIKVEFDYSDDMTIAAAEATLKKLEGKRTKKK